MSAEQSHFHPHELWRQFKERFRPQVIEQFSLHDVFLEYGKDEETLGLTEARRRRRSLLESYLRTYVQEAVGERTVFPYPTHVYREGKGRVIFHNLLYKDVELEQETNTRTKEDNPTLRTHYQAEFKLWRRVFDELTDEVIDELSFSADEIEVSLSNKGARSVTLNTQATSFNMDTLAGLAQLFPELTGVTELEVLELPKKLIFASPSFPFYHDGQTTLARHCRIVYIPRIQEFVILTEGLFTGYSDTQIAKLHQLGEEPQIPRGKQEIFERVQALSSLYSTLPPYAVFEEIIKVIGGEFKPAPIGEGVVPNPLAERDLSTQIAYMEQILDLERELCRDDPTRRRRLHTLLAGPTQLVMQSALRNQLITDIPSHLNNYLQCFASPENSGGKKEFIANTLSLHPDFATRVVSLVDCGTGTVLGGYRPISPDQLQSLLGNSNFELLKQIENTGLTDQTSLKDFCDRFNKDFRRYNTRGQCALCGRETFIWSRENEGCDVCPVCEIKDDLGIFGHLPEQSEGEEQGQMQWETLYGGSHLCTLNDAVASICTPIAKLHEKII